MYVWSSPGAKATIVDEKLASWPQPSSPCKFQKLAYIDGDVLEIYFSCNPSKQMLREVLQGILSRH